MSEFKRNIALDAALIKAGMEGGFDGVMLTAMRLGLTEPDEALKRAEWLKLQPEDYIETVIAKIMEWERS